MPTAVVKSFTERMRKAVDVAKKKGAILNSRAATAQAALESAWGQSLLAARYCNLFGIKAGSDWKGPTVDLWTYEWYGKRDQHGKPIYEKVMAKWRVYPSWNECLVDYSNLIQTRWWFRDALPHADPPHGDGNWLEWIRHLVDRDEPGEYVWATSPDYVRKVASCMAVIEQTTDV
jgi:flagellar protein FlgJ